MRHGILSYRGDAQLGEVAGIMAEHRVHAVAITNGLGARLTGVVSDLDVIAAVPSGEERVARQTVATEPFAVSAAESLYRAAQLMAEHGVVHDAASGYPTGILSTLDIAAAYADRPEVSTFDGAKREGRTAR